MKRSCLIPVVVLVLVMGCLIAAGIGYLWLAAPASLPMVLIDSPRNGERVGVDQETIIHAVARSEQKIKRVELWVDGALRDAQTSSVPGGVSPFPIVVNWRPPVSGTHNIIVRAFTTQNARGHASINVEAQASGDRDNDSVPDAIDGCPDQPGLSTNNGCPAPTAGDRDGDGVLDSADACADQPGTTLANGCPDADGDGVPDGVDACPREVGTAESNGCPAPGDADGDGVADASDACPRDAGSASLGGCSDRDGDGVRDADDACPDDAGVPGLAGCPDRDADGVRDALDLCPAAAGPATNSGCPVTGAGDSDSDGVRDDTDLAPSEAGSADSGGAPPPGGGSDRDSDGAPDAEEATEDPLSGFDFFMPGYFTQFTDVELQALEFQVTGDYTSVYCYANVADRAAERIGPFASLGARRWDIAAFLGPLNSRRFMAPAHQPLQVHVECSGIVGGIRTLPEPGGGIGEGGGSEAYFDLGSFTRAHDISATTIQETTADSSGGNPGHSFRVKYRVCSPGCKTPVLRAPMITLLHGGGQHRLAWAWAGHSYDINGFKLYMNGNYMFGVDAHSTNHLFHDVPPCGRRFDIQLSAYRGNPHRPDLESPLSNIVTWDGRLCPRTATVSFEQLETGDLRSNDDIGNVGPLFGTLWVNDDRRDFDSHYHLESNHSHAITDFFPRTDFSADLEADDWLTIGATIKDRDPGRNPNDTIFDWEEIIPPAEIRTGERRMTGRGGNTLVIRINVMER